MSFAASLTLKWYTCLGKKRLWLMHYHNTLIWLLLLSVLMISRVQPVCYSGYVLRSSGPLVASGMLSWKNHVLVMADLLCMIVWYVVLYMVKKWLLWYPLTMTYILSC